MNKTKHISSSILSLKSMILIVMCFAMSFQGVFSMESTETIEEEIEFYCEQSQDENVPKEPVVTVESSVARHSLHQDEFYSTDFVKSCYYRLFILYCNISIDFKGDR